MSRKPYRLTKTQLDYLHEMAVGQWLSQGWGGYSSTLTVRILEERGLIRLRRLPKAGGGERWQAQIRPAGLDALRKAGRID